MHPSKFLLVLLLLFGSLFASAEPTHIVILKSKLTTKPTNNRMPPVQKHKYVTRVLKERMTQELRPFANELRRTRIFKGGTVEFLPLIAGIALNLSEAEAQVIQNRPDVMMVVPNGKIQWDRPAKRAQVVRMSPKRNTLATLNEALLLHKVDQAMANGLDIHKPGKTVGIIDTGIDGDHVDLKTKIQSFIKIADDSSTPVDDGSHGTHVAGIIAGGDSSGVQLGVYPGAKLVVANALTSHADMAKALQWMLDPDGNPNTQDQPFVINNSWHIGSADATPFYLGIQALKDADILMCFSAGNAGSSGITRPKEYPVTFTTASVKKDGKISTFSSWGPAKYEGKELQKPEVSSMGEEVLSTLPGGKHGRMSGTSMASPFTAGAVAVLGAHFPKLSPYVISEVLLKTSKQASVSSNWHKQYGNGILDVQKAYEELKKLSP